MEYKIYIIQLNSKNIPLFKFQCGGLCFVWVWNLTRHSNGRTNWNVLRTGRWADVWDLDRKEV